MTANLCTDATNDMRARGWDRRCPVLPLTSMFSEPGAAQAAVDALPKGASEKAHAQAWLDYLRGEMDYSGAQARALAKSALASGDPASSGGPAESALASDSLAQDGNLASSPAAFDERMSAAMLLSLAAMYNGNAALWREGGDVAALGRSHSAAASNDDELHRFWCAAIDSAIWSDVGYPQRFCDGNFDFLPADAFAAARFYYVKHLLVRAHDARLEDASDNHKDILLYAACRVCEPFISQTKLEGAYIAELYLHLLCAVAFCAMGDGDAATSHVGRAIDLAIPDGLASPLVEYAGRLDMLLLTELRERDERLFGKVCELGAMLGDGWTRLHNEVLGRMVSLTLTPREREMASLALTLTNKEIAAKLRVSAATVKSTLRSAMLKTGAENRRDLVRFL